MKKWLCLFLSLCLMMSCAAVLADQQWAIDNGLNKTETVEELYAAALEEGGVLNLYGCSGRDEVVANAFMEEYPGITVNFYDLGINEMLEKFTREYEAGIHTADVLQLKEQSGSITNEYIAQGLLHNYHPEDIFGDVNPEYLCVTPFVIELCWWSYNTELHESMPISSWWDLTKEEWRGKYVVLDPTSEPDLIVLFENMIRYADDMAADYERVFGEPITLAENEPNAGYAWINRFANNGIILETANGTIVKDVGGLKGLKDAPLGYGVSSMLRKRDSDGFVIGVDPAAFQDKTPSTAISFMVAQITDQCEHPNAAKLFVRYICGEVDHTGEGLKPFLVAGSYPVFPNSPEIPYECPSFESISTFELDFDYYYDNYYDVYDYWLSVQP